MRLIQRQRSSFYVGAFLVLGATATILFFIWQEWALQQALAARGVMGEGAIVDCGSGPYITGSEITFEAVRAGESVARPYTISLFGLLDCEPGASIPVLYLPEDPSAALPPGHSSIGVMVMVMGIVLFSGVVLAVQAMWGKGKEAG